MYLLKALRASYHTPGVGKYFSKNAHVQQNSLWFKSLRVWFTLVFWSRPKKKKKTFTLSIFSTNLMIQTKSNEDTVTT